MFTRTTMLLSASALALSLAAPALADSVSIKSVIGAGAPIVPHIAAPSFSDDRIAFFGRDSAQSADGLFTVSARDGAVHPLVYAGDTAPNSPNAKIYRFSTPAFFAGRAAFAGGTERGVALGIYTESPEGLKTFVDLAASRIAVPAIAATPDILAMPGLYMTAAGHTKVYLRDGASVPGGIVAENGIGAPVASGTTIAFTCDIKVAGGGTETAVLALNRESGNISLIAGPRSVVPGVPHIAAFDAVATDGASVAFIARVGSVDSSARIVGVAPATGGAIRVIAATGAVSPVRGLKYAKFESLASASGRVYFSAVVDHPAAPVSAVLCSTADSVATVLVAGDRVDGRKFIDAAFGPAGAAGASLAIVARTASDEPADVRPSLLVVTINPAPRCTADVDADGDVGPQDLFTFVAMLMSRDPRADLDGSGETNEKDLYPFLEAYFSTCGR